MSNNGVMHPPDEELLQLLDGELPGREAALLHSHMNACWTCRTRLEQFKSSIGEYVRYRGSVLNPALPAPPDPWADLRPRFQEVDRSLEAEPLAQTTGSRPWFRLRPTYWVAAAACLIVSLFVVILLERAPAVKAAELLRKASADQASVDPRRSIRVKSRHHVITRPALLTPRAPSVTGTDDLRQVFDSARFDWNEPLSARAYAAWHDRLLEKRDAVEAIDHDESAGVAVYVVHTSTVANTLRHATLTLRASDLRPMREMLEFTTDTVEITDLPEATGNEIAEAPLKSSRPPARVPAPERPPAGATSPAHQELEVFTALHQIGADLGEPIEIHQGGSQLLVLGTGLTETRKEQLKSALSEISGVAVRFVDPSANGGPSNATVDRAAPAAAPMQGRLQALLGNRESAEEFTNRVLDASDAAMARVHALRALARAFPPQIESGLAAGDITLLRSLRDDHAAALSMRIADLQRILKPVIPQSAALPMPEPAPGWQRGAEDLFAAAQQVDDLLNAALATSGGAGDDSDFRKLGLAVARLQSQLTAFEKTRP